MLFDTCVVLSLVLLFIVLLSILIFIDRYTDEKSEESYIYLEKVIEKLYERVVNNCESNYNDNIIRDDLDRLLDGIQTAFEFERKTRYRAKIDKELNLLFRTYKKILLLLYCKYNKKDIAVEYAWKILDLYKRFHVDIRDSEILAICYSSNSN